MDQFLQSDEMIPEEERPADPVVRAELDRLVNRHGSNPEGNWEADIVEAVPNLFLNPDFALPIFFDFELADGLDGPCPTESVLPLESASCQNESIPAYNEASGTSSRGASGAGPLSRPLGALDNSSNNSTASTEVISSPVRDLVAGPIPDRADEVPENQPSGSGVVRPRFTRRSLRSASTSTVSSPSSSKAKRKEPKPPVRHRYYLRRRREDDESEEKIAPKKRKNRKQ